ncbi:hypothetical protein WN51_02384 [Melipona quadrifasciata]|uniref:Uncharacterized protein n=1 Tax=Melipona quadrifasciata TaxID=166423 RepID=A0A0N0BEL8_9HYME|nr:hypothetical protein WN51_02384 [Melipona quadrifasciata]
MKRTGLIIVFKFAKFMYNTKYRFTWNGECVAREKAVANGGKGACSNIARIFDVDVAILRCVSSVTDRLVPQWEAAARSWERQSSLVIRTNIRTANGTYSLEPAHHPTPPPPVVTLSARGIPRHGERVARAEATEAGQLEL